MKNIREIHERAVQRAKNLKHSESEMLDSINEVQQNRVWQEMGSPSLHGYIVKTLKLTDTQAYEFSRVAKTSLQIPELKLAIELGDLNVSTARRLTSVITPENQQAWIEKAMTLPQRILEMEIVKVNPKPEPKARIRPIAKERMEMKVGISETLETKLRKIQDLIAQKTKKHCTIEDALDAMAEGFLEKNDPVRKAERALVLRRKSTKAPAPAPAPYNDGIRRPLPAATKHAIMLRDRRQCCFITPYGRCTQTRWTDVHHIVPIFRGGGDNIENLLTLCSAHHRKTHQLLGASKFASARRNAVGHTHSLAR